MAARPRRAVSGAKHRLDADGGGSGSGSGVPRARTSVVNGDVEEEEEDNGEGDSRKQLDVRGFSLPKPKSSASSAAGKAAAAAAAAAAGDEDVKSSPVKRRRVVSASASSSSAAALPAASAAARAEGADASAAAGGPAPTSEQFQRGSIVRIKICNFVTYDDVEVWPGSRLNLVVGPNGAGKSTLTAAIFFGLAGKPKDFGRADHMEHFVKKGKDKAVVEIELYQCSDSGENVVISRALDGDTGKSVWALDSRHATEKAVREFVASLNIQVDNLCVFLAQEKVVAFAKMSPVELLCETEEAISLAELKEPHDRLKALAKERVTLDAELAAFHQRMKRLEGEAKELDAQLEKQQEADKLRKKVEVLRKYRYVLEEEIEEKKVIAAKEAVDKSAAELKEEEKKQGPMRGVVKDLEKGVRQAREGYDQSKLDFKQLDDRRTSLSTQIDTATQDVTAKQTELAGMDQRKVTLEKELAVAKEELKKAQDEVNRLPSEADRQTKLSVLEREGNDAREAERKATTHGYDLNAEWREVHQSVGQMEKQLHDLQNVRMQRLSFVATRDPRNARVKEIHDFLQSRASEFEKPVFGPLFLEVNVSNPLHAKWIDLHMGVAQKFSYVCQTFKDWDRLVNMSKANNWRITIYDASKHVATLEQYESAVAECKARGAAPPPHPATHPARDRLDVAAIRNKGFSFLDECITCPPVVKLTLFSLNFCHLVVCTPSDKKETEDVLAKDKSDAGAPLAMYNALSSYRVKFSRYLDGPKGRLSNVLPLPDPRLFVPVDTTAAAEIEIKLGAERKREDDLKVRIVDAQKVAESHRKKKEQIENEKKKLAALKSERAKYLHRLQLAQKRANDTQHEVATEGDQRDGLKAEIRPLNLERGTKNIALALAASEWMKGALERDSLVLQLTDAVAKLEFVKDEVRASDRVLQEFKARVIDAQKRHREAHLKWEEKKHAAEEVVADEDLFAYEWLLALKTLEDLDTESAKTQLQLENAAVGPADLQSRHDAKHEDLAHSKEDVTSKTRQRAENEREMQRIRDEWLPLLTSKVALINNEFATRMTSLGCKGKVELRRGGNGSAASKRRAANALAASAAAAVAAAAAVEDGAEEDGKGMEKERPPTDAEEYDKYALVISVAYRSQAALKPLSGTSQSGGERSVATMIYLLCLQSTTACPFRVVDEINQGMDAVNERRIFNLITESSEARHAAPQYFLVTPKLLPDLKYARSMRIHTVFNGQWQSLLGNSFSHASVKAALRRGREQRKKSAAAASASGRPLLL